MSGGMCKICTYHIFIQLALFKNVLNMLSYNSSIFLK